ncbi:MAG: NAD(P)-dependent oxidoreductase, partial [Acidimicrobiia bacterium]
MAEPERILVSCRLVWPSESEVTDRLAGEGLLVDMPRFDGQQLNQADLLPIIDRYVGVLAGDDELNRTVLTAAKHLRVISKWGIGIDAIDVAAAEDLGIAVFNTPGVFGEELADYAMGYLHLLARRQHEVDRMVRTGTWHKVTGTSLAGKTIGIVGMGSAGRALARRAFASSMKVLVHDVVEVAPAPEFEVVTLEQLVERSD